MWVLLLGLAGCRASAKTEDLEKQLEAQLASQGMNGQVSCPRGVEAKVGATFTCRLEIEKSTYDVDIVFTSMNATDATSGQLGFSASFSRGEALVRSVIERNLQQTFSDKLGASVEVSCGAEPLVFRQDGGVTCQLRNGKLVASATLAIEGTGHKLEAKVTHIEPTLLGRKELEDGLRHEAKARLGSEIVIDCGPDDIVARPVDGIVRCRVSKGDDRMTLAATITPEAKLQGWTVSAP